MSSLLLEKPSLSDTLTSAVPPSSRISSWDDSLTTGRGSPLLSVIEISEKLLASLTLVLVPTPNVIDSAFSKL